MEIVPVHDYVAESRHIIYANDDITIENALHLNKCMQNNLMTLQSKLEQMLLDCQVKYKRNEDILKELSCVSTPVMAKARCTYYYCGYPYFKNREAFGAPAPSDYIQRVNRREMFPLALDGNRAFWTARDKFQIVQAIKLQLLKFLQTKSNDQIRSVRASGSMKAEGEIAMIRMGSFCF